MKAYRIWALILRHLYLLPRTSERLTDLFFWPIVDVALWGMGSAWLSSGLEIGKSRVQAVLICLVLWRIIFQCAYVLGINLLEECFNRNLTNLLSTPVSKWEWLSSNMLLSLINTILVTLLSSAVIWSFYHVNIFSIGWVLAPLFIGVIIFGWTSGLFASALVLRGGLKAQALAWTVPWMFMPFCAVYFPASEFPAYLQAIAHCLPATYTFEATRKIVLESVIDWQALGLGAVLNVIFFLTALWFYNWIFERTRARGFDHLE